MQSNFLYVKKFEESNDNGPEPKKPDWGTVISQISANEIV